MGSAVMLPLLEGTIGLAFAKPYTSIDVGGVAKQERQITHQEGQPTGQSSGVPQSVMRLVLVTLNDGLLMIPAVEINMSLRRGHGRGRRDDCIAHPLEACAAADGKLIDRCTLQMRYTSHDIHSFVE